MAKESTLWAWLKAGVDGTKGPVPEKFDINRIENSATSGMADVEGVLDGAQFWIELKRCTMLSKLKAIEFEPGQIPFLEKRWRCAPGSSWLLMGVGEGHEFRRFLIRGCEARRFESPFTLDEAEELSVIDPKATPREVIYAAACKGF